MKVEEGESVVIFDAKKKEERREKGARHMKRETQGFGLRLPNNNKPRISPFSFVLARPVECPNSHILKLYLHILPAYQPKPFRQVREKIIRSRALSKHQWKHKQGMSLKKSFDFLLLDL